MKTVEVTVDRVIGEPKRHQFNDQRGNLHEYWSVKAKLTSNGRHYTQDLYVEDHKKIVKGHTFTKLA